CMQRTHWPCSF
nr:immunoglobulin light chain junction region [Macaca mulatta]